MKLLREDLWRFSGLPVLYVVTTNPVVNRKGALVMGRGAAKQATEKIPGIEYECAKVLKGALYYCFKVVREPTTEKAGFGIFQVKHHWKTPASLRLIEESVKELGEWCTNNPQVQVRMNFPGIGNGRLARKDVEPLLKSLPDQVTVCYR